MEKNLQLVEEDSILEAVNVCEFYEDSRLVSLNFSSSGSYGLQMLERQEDGSYEY